MRLRMHGGRVTGELDMSTMQLSVIEVMSHYFFGSWHTSCLVSQIAFVTMGGWEGEVKPTLSSAYSARSEDTR
jgi:hypothetical protein